MQAYHTKLICGWTAAFLGLAGAILLITRAAAAFQAFAQHTGKI